MFKKLHEAAAPKLAVTIDGVVQPAETGETVAALLLRQEEPWAKRNPVNGDKRAPYCMMGVCFECVAEVDGVGSVQTCLIHVAEGMNVSRSSGKRRWEQ